MTGCSAWTRTRTFAGSSAPRPPPRGKKRETNGPPLASLGANASTSRGAEEKAPVAKTVPPPAAAATSRQLDKDKRKREDREAEDFESLLASHEAERASGSQPARVRSSFETKAYVTARRPPVTKPAPAPVLPVSRIRGRSSLPDEAAGVGGGAPGAVERDDVSAPAALRGAFVFQVHGLRAFQVQG